MKKIITLIPLCFILMLTRHLIAEEFGGIEFPQGALSFVDEVISYEPDYSGGATPTENLDPSAALGPPDYPASSGIDDVTLGSGGRITLKFVNNSLNGSGDSQPDLHIFEVGPQVEDTFVEISRDGINWHSIGKVFGGTSSIDIDAFGFGINDVFYYVRLTDDPNEGETSGRFVGADIDAVGAISTTTQVHMPDLSIETAILISFPSLPGSIYTIQKSTNLENWFDSVTGIVGDGTEKKFFFEITNPETFYRIKNTE